MKTIPQNIRRAIRAEAGTLVRLINAAFEAERFFVDGDRINLDKVHELFDVGLFLVLEANGEMAGCVYLEQKGDRVYLGLLSIDPTRQRTGLGSKLLEASEAYCREHGCLFLDLRVVSVRKELPEYYRRMGFVETGTGAFPEEVPTKLPCHFIIMTKRILLESQSVNS